MPLCVPQPTLSQTTPDTGATAERSHAEATARAEAAFMRCDFPPQDAELFVSLTETSELALSFTIRLNSGHRLISPDQKKSRKWELA